MLYEVITTRLTGRPGHARRPAPDPGDAGPGSVAAACSDLAHQNHGAPRNNFV